MRRALRTLLVTAAVAGGVATAPLGAAPAAAASGGTFYRPADGILHLSGHGYGHGHGMSQWGAYGGAQSGAGYTDILDWYYADPSIGTRAGTIRVQLSDGRGSDNRDDTQVLPAAGLTAVDAAGHSLTVPATAHDGSTYDRWRATVTSSGVLRVQGHRSDGWHSVAVPGGSTGDWSGWVRWSDAAHLLTLVRPNGTRLVYRDVLEFHPTGGSAGITINRTSLDHYVYGVVPSEMPCSWTPTVGGVKRLDALEAQAVAARSYGAWRMDHPRSSVVDAVDTTYDQAYSGYSAERTAARECPWTSSSGATTSASDAAVDGTAGQVLTDDSGAVLFAQFSASNGGFEADGGSPHLPARPDAWDGVPTDTWSSHSWTDTVSAASLEGAFPGIGSFTALTVNSREQLSGTDQNGRTVGEQWGGRITSLTVFGSAGSTTVSGDTFRGDLGLRSPWFTVVVHRPTAPQSLTATAGEGQAVLSWTPPGSDGGGGIRSYRITATPAIPPVTVDGSTRTATITGLSDDTSYTFSVTAQNTAGTGPAATTSAATPSSAGLFHPVRHARIFDTRRSGGALAAGSSRVVQVAGAGGVPATGVTSVLLDVVTAGSAGAGGATVWAPGASRPPDPQLTWGKGQLANALVWSRLDTRGRVELRAGGATATLVVDTVGYFTPAADGGSLVQAVSPVRVFDSRHGSPVSAKATVAVPVVGRAGVPSGATAAVLQLTAAAPARRTYVSAWPSQSSRSVVSDLYAPAKRYTTATAVVPLDDSGSVTLSPSSTSHLVVEVVGWFAPAGADASTGAATALPTPQRVTSRTLAARSGVSLSVAGTGAVPDGARCVVLTVTGTSSRGGHLTVWPTGARRPGVSSVHLIPGVAAGDTVVVPAGSNGAVTVASTARAATRLVVDVHGWCG